MFDRLAEETIFSKSDLKASFHQIRVLEEYVQKTKFNTQYGQQ